MLEDRSTLFAMVREIGELGLELTELHRIGRERNRQHLAMAYHLIVREDRLAGG